MWLDVIENVDSGRLKERIEESGQVEDSRFSSNCDIPKIPFELPKQFAQSISENLDKIKKKQVKDGVNGEINKIELNAGPSKIILKSVSSVYSKDVLNETGTSLVKVSEIEHEIPSIRRSLRTYDKPKEKELQDSAKKTNKLPQMKNKTDIKKRNRF
ncbi:Hypothetical protein CINCED_3A005563 [Cinara cedri]|uniref:Uncharacterized protein n=1 Tax=Cinara cedri TaxID=506608 RepID=A0A5E4N687_9HEMI|nr:Hypothetical protein CINCED_3A005563 [Cinara cedri]